MKLTLERAVKAYTIIKNLVEDRRKELQDLEEYLEIHKEIIVDILEYNEMENK